MPTQLPEAKFRVTSQEIRMFLRDQPEYNILLDDVEHSDAQIELAMKLAVAKWNAITPISNLIDASQMNEYLLLCGVCGLLLKSEGIRQKRNQLMTQDGNISPIGLDEKEAIYLKWAMHFQQEFDQKAQAMKIQQNMESLFDGTHTNYLGSGYRYIGRYTL